MGCSPRAQLRRSRRFKNTGDHPSPRQAFVSAVESGSRVEVSPAATNPTELRRNGPDPRVRGKTTGTRQPDWSRQPCELVPHSPRLDRQARQAHKKIRWFAEVYNAKAPPARKNRSKNLDERVSRPRNQAAGAGVASAPTQVIDRQASANVKPPLSPGPSPGEGPGERGLVRAKRFG